MSRNAQQYGWHDSTTGVDHPPIAAPGSEDKRCGVCGEAITVTDARHGNYAEMYDPQSATDAAGCHAHVICHAECGLQRGYKVA